MWYFCRYVDTFNKGGGNPTNLFQSPSIPSVRPTSGANPKFFVPSPVSSSEQTLDTMADGVQETTSTNESSSIPAENNSFHSPGSSYIVDYARVFKHGQHCDNAPTSMAMQRFPSMDRISNNAPTSMAMQRFPSMDSISNNGTVTNGSVSVSSHSRRTASWSGSLNNAYSSPPRTEVKPLGEMLRMQPSSYVPSEPSLVHLPRNGGSFGMIFTK